MFDLSTIFIYCGLLAAIMVLLWTKKPIHNISENQFLSKYNEISAPDIVILLILTIIVGLRYDVGVDWINYKGYFENFDSFKDFSFSDHKMEYGFYLINSFAYSVNGGFLLVCIITAAISWFFILKSFPTILLPLTFFFIFCDGYFFWSMNGVRQFMAISIFACAIKYIIKREAIKYLIFILIASLFHQSVLLLLPLYFIPYQKLYNQKIWTIVFVFSFVLSQTPFIVQGLVTIISSIAEYIPFLDAYVHYFDSQYYEVTDVERSGLGYIFRILIAFTLLYFSKSIIRKYPQTKIYFILFFFGTVIFNLFFMLQIVGRFVTYFIFFRAYLLAILVFYLYHKKLSYVGLAISFLYFIIFLTDIYNSANQCCPYQFNT